MDVNHILNNSESFPGLEKDNWKTQHLMDLPLSRRGRTLMMSTVFSVSAHQ